MALDTRIPMAVPNVLAMGQQVAQTNALNANALGQGFNAIQQGLEAPMRRNALALDNRNAELAQTQAEQQMLGQVLDGVAQNPATWGRARQFLVQNGVFQEGELPEQLTPQAFEELSVIAFTPPEQLTDYERQIRDLNSDNPMRRQAAGVALNIVPGANAVLAAETAGQFNLGQGQTRFDRYGNPIASVAPEAKERKTVQGADGHLYYLDTGERALPNVEKTPEGADLTAQGGLRKEWTALTKDFRAIRDSFGKIQSAATNPSPAGDLALIFNYMKMLDPGSVVREGEFATAQNAGGVDDRVRNLYNQVLEGTRLNASQRQDFVGVSKQIYDEQLRIYNEDFTRYRDIAARGGMDVEATIPDVTKARDVDLGSTTGATAGTQDGDVPMPQGGVPVGHRVTTPEGRVMEKRADGQWYEVTQ